jgi:hypothetical protein
MALRFRELATIINQETQTTTRPPCSCVYPSAHPTAVNCGAFGLREAAEASAVRLEALRGQLRESLRQG